MAEKKPRHMTLNRFLVQRQRVYPGAAGELTRVMDQVGTVGKIISSYMRRAALEAMTGLTGAVNVQGEKVRKLDEVGNAIFVQAFEYVDIVGAIVSEEMERASGRRVRKGLGEDMSCWWTPSTAHPTWTWTVRSAPFSPCAA